MTKYILSFLFSLITIFSFGQEKVTITGKVTDVLNFPLTDSEVILGNKADSTKISTTSTNDDGTFKIEINLQDKPVYLIIDDPLEGVQNGRRPDTVVPLRQYQFALQAKL